MKKIGVLALQGCIDLHKPHIEALGAEFLKVRKKEDFEKADAFILPGGESTTMLKLISAFDLDSTIKENFAKKPVWGICAGAILIASEVTNPEQKSYGLIDMKVVRNGYGRQLDSIEQDVDGYTVSYIRAPVIDSVGEGVEILASRDIQGETKPTWIRSGNYMATTFHPELNSLSPSPMHEYFYKLLRALY